MYCTTHFSSYQQNNIKTQLIIIPPTKIQVAKMTCVTSVMKRAKMDGPMIKPMVIAAASDLDSVVARNTGMVMLIVNKSAIGNGRRE